MPLSTHLVDGVVFELRRLKVRAPGVDEGRLVPGRGAVEEDDGLRPPVRVADLEAQPRRRLPGPHGPTLKGKSRYSGSNPHAAEGTNIFLIQLRQGPKSGPQARPRRLGAAGGHPAHSLEELRGDGAPSLTRSYSSPRARAAPRCPTGGVAAS